MANSPQNDARRAISRPKQYRRATTPPKLARRWGVSADKVIGFIRSGELAAFNIATSQLGRPRYRITPDAIAAFEQRRAAKQFKYVRRRLQRDECVIEFF